MTRRGFMGWLAKGAAIAAMPIKAVLAMPAAPISVKAAYVSKSGNVMFFMIGDKDGNPAYPTETNSPPAIKVNGRLVAVQGPFWTSTSYCEPWIAYVLPSAITARDRVQWTSQKGWIVARQGSALAERGVAV